MRIDAHHSWTPQYTLAYLETILKRNRFERSILVGPPQRTPDFVAGVIAPVAAATAGPQLLGVQIEGVADLERAAAFGRPIDTLGLLPQTPAIAAAHPELSIVIDHLGFPPTGAWERDLEAAAACPNVYCKLSGLACFDRPWARAQLALRLFGPDRLMFGSDWPAGLPQFSWKETLALFTQSIGAQSIDVREQLLGGTAARVYGIPSR